MTWNEHSNLEGSHAFLGASKYHWINYDIPKLTDSFNNFLAASEGTETHDFAARCIKRGQKLPKSPKTLNQFVNDAIGFKMSAERVLYYSGNCYGTADAISFRDGVLRIHDLKTGAIPAHMEQLMIYAALFCLEYKMKPEKIDIELRIYQSDEINAYTPLPEEITSIMEKIVEFDKVINDIKRTRGVNE